MPTASRSTRGRGFGDLGITAADFTAPDRVIQLSRAPNRIDLLTGISGVTADEAFPSRIANKRAVGRPQDIADLSELEN